MNGKPAFHEDYRSPKTSPLHLDTTDFPHDEVARRLGDEVSDDEQWQQRMADAGAALSRILAFATEVPLGKPRTARMMGIRFAASAWCINPNFFPGGPSAAELARLLGYKNPANFHVLTGAVARRLGISNRSQAHGWNRGLKLKRNGGGL